MRWGQGRTVIEQMLSAGDLQRVPASREHADRLLEQARRHVSSTQNAAVADPEGAYALLYDAARKALTAILENQGLRPTSRGGHLAVYHAVRAQHRPSGSRPASAGRDAPVLIRLGGVITESGRAVCPHPTQTAARSDAVDRLTVSLSAGREWEPVSRRRRQGPARKPCRSGDGRARVWPPVAHPAPSGSLGPATCLPRDRP